jgi:iron complex outermembrane receptor protein
MGSSMDQPGAEIARAGRRHFIRPCVAACAAVTAWSTPPARGAEAPPIYESVVRAPATPAVRPREDQTAAASVVTTDRTPRSQESLPLLLAELPGVTVQRLGGPGSLATLSLRGSTSNQVLVTSDGVPLASAATGTVDVAMIPLSALDRLEVYRGSSPLAFGGSAMGGVVALTTVAPRESGLAAHAGSGSFGTRFGGVQGAWAGPRLRLLGRANLFSSDGDFRYRTDDGTVFSPGDDRSEVRRNADLGQIDALARAEVDLPGRRQLATALAFLDRDAGLPSTGAVQAVEARLGTRRLTGSLSYDGRDDLGPGGRVRATAYTLVGEQRLDDPRGEVAFVPTRARDHSTTAGGTFYAARPFGRYVRLAGVLDGRHERFAPSDALAGTAASVPGTRTHGAVGLEADLWAPRLALDVLPSLRLEAAHDDVLDLDLFGRRATTPRSDDRLLPIARLGLVQRPHERLALRANAGAYARLPTLAERYGNGGVILGNPALLPERGLTADLGAALDEGSAPTRVSVDVAAFASTATDLIAFQKGTYHARFRNVGRARILGLEAAAALVVKEHLRVTAQGTWLDARDRSGLSASDGRRLPHRPVLRALVRPEVRALPVGRALRAGLYADADVTGRTYMDPANLIATPTRVLFGAGASLDHRASGLRAVLSAYNLLDSPATDFLYFPLPGRSAFLTLHYSSHAKETL